MKAIFILLTCLGAVALTTGSRAQANDAAGSCLSLFKGLSPGSPERAKRLISGKLTFYGKKQKKEATDLIYAEIAGFNAGKRMRALAHNLDTASGSRPPEIFLISYGDSLRDAEGKRNPLQALHGFSSRRLPVDGTHFLPVHPSTSDGGFAPVDLFAVDPALGSWEDLRRFKNPMYDLVLGHVSGEHRWLKALRSGDTSKLDHFILIRDPKDPRLLKTVRPRTTPLHTDVKTPESTHHLWTTFSSDQFDLNYRNPKVMAEMTKAYLNYLENGGAVTRLDAITYLFKRVGSSNASLSENHKTVELLQTINDLVYEKHPEAFPNGKPMILTETNVPYRENISYFGKKGAPRQADIVYNFSLPPLVLYGLARGDARALGRFIDSVNWNRLPEHATFFNVLATHDGVGLNAARAFLESDKMNWLVDLAKKRGADIGMKSQAGREIPYELRGSYVSMLNDPSAPQQKNVKRLLAAYSVQLQLKGKAGIYINSFLSAENDRALFAATGHGRDLNRTKFTVQEAEHRISEKGSFANEAYQGLVKMIETRKLHPALSSAAKQTRLAVTTPLADKAAAPVLAILRDAPEAPESVLCLTNFSDSPQKVSVDLKKTSLANAPRLEDLLAKFSVKKEGNRLEVVLDPYQSVWLKGKTEASNHP